MRRNGSRALRVFFMSAAATACAVPERDNANDPSRAPAAVLGVIDTGPENACGTEDPQIVAAISRGRCLLLDASATTDPQDTPFDELDYEFFFESASGDDVPLGSGSGGQLTLTRQFKREREPGSLLTFRVDVQDGGNARGSAHTALVLLNSPPVAAGIPARTLRLGGLPGSVATTYTVEHDGSGSTDPDLDDLTYVWRFLGTSDSATGAVVTREFPVDVAGRYFTSLEVSDSNEDSAPSIAEVFVRTPNIWMDRAEDGSPYQRLDSERAAIDLAGFTLASVEAAGFGEDHFVAAFEDNGAMFSNSYIGVFQRNPLIESDGPVALTGAPISVAVDSERAEAWVIERQSSERTLSHWSLDPLAMSGSSLSLSNLVGEIGNEPIVVVDGSGTAWAIQVFGLGGLRVDPDGTSTPILDDDTRWITGAAARPGTEELWMMESPDPFGAAPFVPAELVRYSPGEAPVRIPTDFNHVMGLAFADEDRVWVAVTDVGVMLVNLETLAGGAEGLLAASERIVSDVHDVIRLDVDLATGTCWASTFAGTTYRIGRDGVVSELAGETDHGVNFIDDDGLVWFDRGSTGQGEAVFQRGLAPSTDGLVATIEAHISDFAVEDPRSGGLWIARLFPPAFVLHSESGGRVRVVPEVSTQDGPAPFPPIRRFSISPDGSTVWARHLLEPSVFRIRLTSDPPALETMATGAQASIVMSESNRWILPSADGDSLWTVAGVPSELREVSDSGIAVRETFGADETPPFLAMSPETGRLCTVSLVPWDDKSFNPARPATLHVRLFEVGAPAPLEHWSMTVDTSLQLTGAGASSDVVDGDVCWAALGRRFEPPCEYPNDMAAGETHLQAWRASDGMLVDEFEDLQFYPEDMRMESPEQIWLLTRRCDPGGNIQFSRTVLRRQGTGRAPHHSPAGNNVPFLRTLSAP